MDDQKLPLDGLPVQELLRKVLSSSKVGNLIPLGQLFIALDQVAVLFGFAAYKFVFPTLYAVVPS